MNFRLLKYQSVLLGCIILFISCEKEVPDYDTDMEIQKIMAEYDIPSITACIFQHNKIVWSQSYGNSDIEHQAIATEETIYHIGSISKLFIVTAIMQLEEKGLLELITDINNYLPFTLSNPNFPDDPITIKMLLTHTSGLVSGTTDIATPHIWDYYPPDQSPAMQTWITQFLSPGGEFYTSHVWSNNKPGTFETYSNFGSCLLAYIVEQLSGEDFRTYCSTNIFKPLKMNNTSYHYSELDLNKIAVLYQENNQLHSFSDYRLYASGGVKSNVMDMSRFLMAYLNNGEVDGSMILTEESVKKILKIQNIVSGTCLIWKASFGNWFGHTGDLSIGAAGIVEIHPSSATGYVIFCNKPTNTLKHGQEVYGLIKQKLNESIQ